MSYFSKKRFTMRQVIGLLTIVFLGIVAVAYAVTVDFTPGTTISSTAVENAINQNRSVAVCSAEVLSVTLTTSTSDINTVSITVPGPGTVLVSGSGTFRVNNSGAAAWEGDVWIADTSGGNTGDVRNFWGGPTGLPAGDYWSPVHEQRTFTVGAAGTYPYYLTGRYYGTQTVYVYRSSICAVFTPS